MIVKRNLSIPEYVQTYGYCRSTVYAEIRSGELKTIKIRNRTLVPIEAAEDLQERRMAEAGIAKREVRSA